MITAIWVFYLLVFVMTLSRRSQPISGAAVDGRFLRTSNSRDDVDFAMHEVRADTSVAAQTEQTS